VTTLGMSRRLRAYAHCVGAQNLLIAAVLLTSHNALVRTRAWRQIFNLLPWQVWSASFAVIAIGMLVALLLNNDTLFRPLAVVSSSLMTAWAASFALVIPRALTSSDVSWMGFILCASLATKDWIVLGQPMSPRLDSLTDRVRGA
jgi:hypothetical protein